MAQPYIPPTDAALRAWAVNYADLITAAPATYGLDAPAALAIQDAVDEFVEALDAYTKDTRTVVLVAAKNAAKFAMLALVRTYSAQIRLNPGVSNENKLALGLNLPNTSPSPIPAPATSPILAFVGATPGQHTLRFADTLTPDSRRKPFGVVALQLFLGIGVAAIPDPADCAFYATITKQPTPVDFDPADAGKVATYYGRWVTRSGPGGVAQSGPWSAQLTAVIPAI